MANTKRESNCLYPQWHEQVTGALCEAREDTLILYPRYYPLRGASDVAFWKSQNFSDRRRLSIWDWWEGLKEDLVGRMELLLVLTTTVFENVCVFPHSHSCAKIDLHLMSIRLVFLHTPLYKMNWLFLVICFNSASII